MRSNRCPLCRFMISTVAPQEESDFEEEEDALQEEYDYEEGGEVLGEGLEEEEEEEEGLEEEDEEGLEEEEDDEGTSAKFIKFMKGLIDDTMSSINCFAGIEEISSNVEDEETSSMLMKCIKCLTRGCTAT